MAAISKSVSAIIMQESMVDARKNLKICVPKTFSDLNIKRILRFTDKLMIIIDSRPYVDEYVSILDYFFVAMVAKTIEADSELDISFEISSQ